MRRKNVVVALFDAIHNDIVREIDSRVQTEQFQKRLAVDKRREWQDEFIASIKSQSVARAEVFKGKAGAWFASNEHLGKAVSDGLALSTLAKAKYNLWLRDRTLTLRDMGYQVDKSRYHDYQVIRIGIYLYCCTSFCTFVPVKSTSKASKRSSLRNSALVRQAAGAAAAGADGGRGGGSTRRPRQRRRRG